MTVWTGGTFDLIHPGHVHLLRECRRMAGPDGLVVVAVNSDQFIEKYKGRRPVQRLQERLEMVEALRYVDHVQVNPGGSTQRDLIVSSGARTIVIGDDWLPPRDYHAQIGVNDAWLRERLIKIEYVTRFGSFSSTSLKESVRASA